MADRGHELTDELLDGLERRLAEEYAQASRDMQRKFREYMERFDAEDAAQRKLLEAGKITQADYSNWRFRHMMMGKRWEAMRDTLAADMEHTNEIALRLSRGRMPDVYALNANYGTYQIEHDGRIDTGFTLYNHDAAERLLTGEHQMMPGPSTRKAAQIAADKSMQWNRQKIQSAVLQGILQGEGPYKVAARLMSVATMNYNASVRYARTMTTNAQNAGRYQSFRRADKLGVNLVIEWEATLDGRTRHEHRMMHGQRRKVDEPFVVDGVKILYPAQSDGPGASDIPQSLIWNCRCTLLAWVKGFEGDTVKSSPKMGGMSFEEWQAEKAPEESQKTPREAKYLYHATRSSSLVGITEKGLLPNKGHVGKGVYFADSIEDAREWTAETSTGGTTVLRVKERFLKAGDFEKWEASETGYSIAESIFKGIIPLEEIEIKVNDNGNEDDWWSLAQYIKQRKSLYNRLSAKAKRNVDRIVEQEWQEYLRRKK